MGQPLVPGVPASITNPMVKHIIKPENGNWRDGNFNVEHRLAPYKASTQNKMVPSKSPKDWYDKHMETLNRNIEYDKERGYYGEADKARYARMKQNLDNAYALDKWIDSNLTNYMKKQMGTENDPVRLLADQGISHYTDLAAMRRDLGSGYNQTADNRILRQKLGMPANSIAETHMGKSWEEGVDALIGNETQLLSK